MTSYDTDWDQLDYFLSSSETAFKMKSLMQNCLATNEKLISTITTTGTK